MGKRERDGFAVLKIDGGDRLVGQRLEARAQRGELRAALRERSDLEGGDGDHDGIEAAGLVGRLDEPTRAFGPQRGHADAEPDLGATLAQPIDGGIRKNGREVEGGNQEVGVLAPPEERVAHHVREDLRVGIGDRRVQRRDAERLPEEPPRRGRLALFVEQLRDGDRLGDAAGEAQPEACRRPAIAPGETLRAGEGGGEVERRRQGGARASRTPRRRRG
jgi:hypothetical protein